MDSLTVLQLLVENLSKFLKLSSDSTLRRKGKLQRFLRTLKSKEFFTKEQYDTIYPYGSQPAIINCTLRTYKLKSPTDTLTFRPIVSSIGTCNYNLAKVLTDTLDPAIPTEYCAKDSFSFRMEIQEVNSSNKFMIPYDVCSLFTSISLKETIDIAVNLIFDKYPDLKIARKNFKKLFEFATPGTHVIFDGNYYDQIDGVAMGSPLGPVLANLCDVLLYCRYVDDILCLILSKMPMSFLNFSILNILILNSHLKNRKMTN